jgi:hypothetical protein
VRTTSGTYGSKDRKNQFKQRFRSACAATPMKSAVKHNNKQQTECTYGFELLTSQLWEEGTISSSFLPVKMSMATK